MEEFCVIKDLTILEVIPLGITKTLFEIVLDGQKGLVFTRVEVRLDFVEGDGLLDDNIIIGVHAFVGETEKVG